MTRAKADREAANAQRREEKQAQRHGRRKTTSGNGPPIDEHALKRLQEQIGRGAVAIEEPP